jgi:hypothetical protein
MSDWKPGEPISSRKLNQHSAARAQTEFSGPPGSVSKFGQNFGMLHHDLTNTGMWIRVTSPPVDSSVVVTGDIDQSVKLHSWEAIMWNDGLKKWQANPSNFGNATTNPNSTEAYDYDAVISADLGNLTQTPDANLTANMVAQTGVTPYFAVRDPVSRRLIAVTTGGGGGNFNANSTETVLMILGEWTDYKDCPDAPPAPPMSYADYPCSDARTTTPCVPAYAYAVYQRFGYVWNKIGDSRTYGVWATELNGGGTTAWRRFVIPRWGGNFDPTTGLPDPEAACMGVAFVGGGGSALTCSCPAWATTGQCLKVTYTIIDRPFPTGNGGYSDCNDVFLVFDAGDGEGPYWGSTFEALINQTGSLCFDGSDGSGPLGFAIQYLDTARDQCDWGPDVFDPCNPCEGFGRFYITGEINGVEERPNCGSAGHFDGYLSIPDIVDIICNCATKSLRELTPCDGCDGTSGELPPLHFVDMESIEITCCDETEPEGTAIFGGTADEPSEDAAFGGTADGPATDIYDGGGA